MTTAAPDKALEEARWNLDPLVDGEGAEGTLELLAEARERSVAFAEEHRGKVSELDAARPRRPRCASSRTIFDKVGRAGSYASLWFTVDTADPERGALLQQVQERGAEIETSLHLLRARVERAARRSGRGAAWRRTSSSSAAITCGPRAATARTS